MQSRRDNSAVDREALETIVSGGFECPAGTSVAELTRDVLPYLGATDSHLRENTLEILSHWIEAGRYNDEELLAIGRKMAANLSARLGESGTDSVFLRSFSALVLEAVIHVDDLRAIGAVAGQKPFLSHAQVLEWFEAGLSAFDGEVDFRGFAHGQGWAHAIAHKADLLGELARGRHLDAPCLERILVALADKLTRPADTVLLFEEDNRLVRAAVHVLLRNELDAITLHAWIDRFASLPDGRSWGSTLGLHECDQAGNRARVNTRNFLRCLYFALLWGMRGPGDAAEPGNPHHAYYDRAIEARAALLGDVERALRGMNRPMYKDEESA